MAIRLIVTKNYEEMCDEAFKVFQGVLDANPAAILGLATGSTPIGLYQRMIKEYQEGKRSYQKVTTVNLDEYVGLGEENEQSYVYFMNDNLFNHIDIKKENVNLPNGKVADMQAECDRYNALLKTLKQDVQLLGIGGNGHIAFNEPGTSFDEVTHYVELDERTRKDNSRFFASIDEVPTHALSMGIANVLNAKKILLLANGAGKADAVKAMLEGEISTSCPASALRTHEDVVVICDEAAASKLSK